MALSGGVDAWNGESGGSSSGNAFGGRPRDVVQGLLSESYRFPLSRSLGNGLGVVSRRATQRGPSSCSVNECQEKWNVVASRDSGPSQSRSALDMVLLDVDCSLAMVYRRGRRGSHSTVPRETRDA
jgi:hypothetical protein